MTGHVWQSRDNQSHISVISIEKKKISDPVLHLRLHQQEVPKTLTFSSRPTCGGPRGEFDCSTSGRDTE